MARHKSLQISHAFIVPNSQVDVKQKMKLEGALCFGVPMSFTPLVRSPRYIRVLLNIGRNRESEKSESESTV